MSDASLAALKKTPLHGVHAAAGARLVPFAGWEMPVEYTGVTDEHLAVRNRAGLFDVSHMGEVEIAGSQALPAIQHLTSNDASKLKVGQIQYSGLMTPKGTFIDDLLVYRWADNHYLLVVNAANTDKDFAWIRNGVRPFGDAVAVNTSNRYALIALQGPAAREVLQPLTGIELAAMKYYWFATGEVAGVRVTVSRTGYTGEDGFEIFVPPAQAPAVWRALAEAGRTVDLRLAGLAARDTLRLEAAMRLYGNDIDDTTTPVEADLNWIVGWNKGEFLGSDVLHREKAEGPARRMVGIELLDRGIARPGHAVLHQGLRVGVVTSGTQTPFLKKAIGLAYVPASLSAAETPLEIDVRGRAVAARTVPLPFYKRTRS